MSIWRYNGGVSEHFTDKDDQYPELIPDMIDVMIQMPEKHQNQKSPKPPTKEKGNKENQENKENKENEESAESFVKKN